MLLRLLDFSARFCALAAGTLLTLVTVMTCASVVGRNILGATLAGDFELTGVATGLAIALFMPWCQLRQGNIIVDFFTSGTSAATRGLLDRLGAWMMVATMLLLAWRTSVGALNAWNNHSGSMLMGFPDWVVYAGMVPPFALTAMIALCQAIGAMRLSPRETT